MKPFDLEKAKAGAKVVTRDGQEVRLLYFDIRGAAFPIVGLVDIKVREYVMTWDVAGCELSTQEPSPRDLFPAPTLRAVWLLYNPEHVGWMEAALGLIFSRKEEAESYRDANPTYADYVPHQIEIEV